METRRFAVTGAASGIGDAVARQLLSAAAEVYCLDRNVPTLDQIKDLLGRHDAPDDIAGAVVFLSSDAARWISGRTLVVDGRFSGAVLSGAVPMPVID